MSKEIPRAYKPVLMGLWENGGAAVMDVHGRLSSTKTKAPIPGDLMTWMTFVAQGLVAGEDGKIMLTQAGRDLAAKYERGRVREA
jgi:predicted methyltransferase